MRTFLSESWLFLVGTANHFFLMMYWVWLPALLLSAYLFSRYHGRLSKAVLTPRWQLLKLVALGATGAGNARTVTAEALTLSSEGSSRLAGAFALTAPHLVLYRLSIIMALVGLEFAVGQFLGAVILLALLIHFGPKLGTSGPVREDAAPKTIASYLWQEARAAWPVLYGLLVSGIIAAAGRQEWWVDLSEVGGGGIVTAVLNAGVGAGLGVILFAPPVANLFIASWIWKAYGLSYTGVIAFILAGRVNPWTIRAYAAVWGWPAARQLALSGLLGSVASALVVSALLWLLGIQVTHVPWFHEIVSPIMDFMSLGGKMPM